MERIIQFDPAYDKRHEDPRKNYGIHGVDIRFLLKGNLGAVQFVISTGWLLPETLNIDDNHAYRYGSALTAKNANLAYPMVVDLGYHSSKPMYEEQTSVVDCHVLGGPCFYDGSSLNAEPVFFRMLKEGHEGVWADLEDYYKGVFGCHS